MEQPAADALVRNIADCNNGPSISREELPMDITAVVSELMSCNRGPDPRSLDERTRPNYGIAASLEGDILSIVLTFRAKSAYCCMEWGCHLALSNEKRWDALRHQLADHGVVAPPQLTLRLSCVVEAGALFFDFSRRDATRRDWYAFKPAAAYEYHVCSIEATNGDDG